MKSGGLAHVAKELADARGDQDSENRLDLFGGEEVAVLAERIALPAVVAVFGMVERDLHEAAERDRARAADLGRQQLAGRGHGWRSRLCGVWMNISTR